MGASAMLLGGGSTVVSITGEIDASVKLCAIPMDTVAVVDASSLAEGETLAVMRGGTQVGTVTLDHLLSDTLLGVSAVSEVPTYGDELVGASGSALCPAAATQLFPDPGVESGLVTGWTKESAATVVAASTEVHGGTYAIRLTGGTINNYIIRAISVEPGKSYIFSVWKKGGGAASNLRLGTTACGTQYANNVLLGTKAVYTQQSVSFVATSATLYVSIGCGAGGTDGGYWDDFSLTAACSNRLFVDLSADHRAITPVGGSFVTGMRPGELAFSGGGVGYASYPDLGMPVGPMWFEMVCTVESTAEMRCAPNRLPFIQIRSVNRVPSVNANGSASWVAGQALVSGQYYRIRGDLVLTSGSAAALRLWVDGVLVGTLALTGISPSAIGANYIAAAHDATLKWVGKISEFVVGTGTPIPYGVSRYQVPSVRWGKA